MNVHENRRKKKVEEGVRITVSCGRVHGIDNGEGDKKNGK
jgi:hypothetical protein